MKQNKKTFYISTPIFYPSGNLHIGHVYTTTIADALTRYKQLQNYDTFFLTGSDEHGEKIEQKAKEHNVDPKTYVDSIVPKFKHLWKLIDVNYNQFIRTTDKFHETAVSNAFCDLEDKGFIYKDFYEGLYSVSDEEFFTTQQAKLYEDGKYYHPVSGHLLKMVKEESYFLKISNFGKWLKTYFYDHPRFVIPQKRVTELVNNFIDPGLKNLSVTRTSFSWGVPVKNDNKHIIYVWIDALLNYVTALGYGSKDTSLFDKFWANEDAEIVHLVGKEITRFHCIYWPIILKMLDLKLPSTILAHGWIITKEGKMSKSKGNVVDPLELINKYGSDPLRYFLLKEIKLNEDGIFDIKHFESIYNNDLCNKYGNLISRSVSMINKYFDGSFTSDFNLSDFNCKVIDSSITDTIFSYSNAMDKLDINSALDCVEKFLHNANKFIDNTTPWVVAKTDPDKLKNILSWLHRSCVVATMLLSPFLVKKSKIAYRLLGVKKFKLLTDLDLKNYQEITVTENEILFPRLP